MHSVLKTPLIQKIIQIDRFLDKQWILYIFLILVVVLRIPSFCEPYWYGDEAIYLTIGNAMNNGELLYKDTVDHKTPIIYFLARVPSQLHFRLLLLVWMLATTIVFYTILKQLFSSTKALVLSMLLFVLFTTLPWFEGNIPNGELFMMGFTTVSVSLFLLACRQALQGKLTHWQIHKRDLGLVAVAGLSAGLAILTKVPALLDWGGLVLLPLCILTQHVHIRRWSSWRHWLGRAVLLIAVFTTGTVVAILASLIWSWSQGTLADYLQYGLLYNLHYSGTWVPTLPTAWLQPATNLVVKAAFMIGAIGILLLLGIMRKMSAVTQFVLGWTVAAFFGTLLSNRPYPHYFLQLIPPLALLAGLLLEHSWQTSTQVRAKHLTWSRYLPLFIEWIASAVVVSTIVLITTQLGVSTYSAKQYYLKWYRLATKQMTPTEYMNSFDGLIEDNTKAAAFLADQKNQKMYIWGTNPVLYAQTKTVPADKFTVSFHVKDLKSYDQTLQNVERTQPQYIVMMKNEQGTFPELESYVRTDYVKVVEYNHYTIWRSRTW